MIWKQSQHKTGILAREHSQCRRIFDAGFQEMVNLAADAARTYDFDEKTLRLTLGEIARRSYGDGNTVNQALEEGSKLGVNHAMADGILTQREEALLREFRYRLALDSAGADRKAAAQLQRASADRLMLDAIATDNPDTHMNELTESLRKSDIHRGQQTALLVWAWEAAVEGTPEDGLLSRDEENALNRYMNNFRLTQLQLDANGVLTQVVKSAVLRDTAEGIVPNRQNITGRVPFNLMKSEQLVWVMQDVDYLEILTRRERRGTSHGLSIRIARGVYSWQKQGAEILVSQSSPGRLWTE